MELYKYLEHILIETEIKLKRLVQVHYNIWSSLKMAE